MPKVIRQRHPVARNVAVLDRGNPFCQQRNGLISGVEPYERLGVELRHVDIRLFKCKEGVQRRRVVGSRDRQLVRRTRNRALRRIDCMQR